MLKVYLYLLFFSFSFILNSQTYQDYVGYGHSSGVQVYSSPTTHSTHSASETISGANTIPSKAEASRFLSQSAFGGDYFHINQVQNMGIEKWIESQMLLPLSSYHQQYIDNYSYASSLLTNKNKKREYLSYAFYDLVLSKPDLLRHKQAFTLSQIFVISPVNSALSIAGYANSSYYDVLYQNAFGNFRDLLEQITLHPAMGIYLSYFQNEKSNPVEDKYPDENYARELLQLFTIGLHQLNNDGTFKTDVNGENIPTYKLEDVLELAKVFTGYSGSALLDNSEATFSGNAASYDLAIPMQAYQEMHDKSSKTIFGDLTIPYEQTADLDIKLSLDYIFNHPNVGPFIAQRLIQHYVTSNPSPEYVNRVALVFNNNGEGTRGDLAAVIKALLLDPEARNCNPADNLKAGRLIQPIERIIHLFRFLNISSPSGKLWLKDEKDIYDIMEQSFLGSPTVFNFFDPTYAEEQIIAPNNMVSPEFQLLNSTTGIHYMNFIENALKVIPFNNKTLANQNLTSLSNNDNDKPIFDKTDEIQVYQNLGLGALIDHVDIALCRGQLTNSTRTIIHDTVAGYSNQLADYSDEDAVNDVIYFMMSSPDYLILK